MNDNDTIQYDWYFDGISNSTIYVIEFEEFVNMPPAIVDMFNAAALWGGPSIRSNWDGIEVIGWEFANF